MKEIIAPLFMASVLTFALAAPAEAQTISVRQGGDRAFVVDHPASNHNRVRIRDGECDGNAVRVEAILSDGSRYTMWNFEGCGKTHVTMVRKPIASFRLCERNSCSPWKDT